MRFMVCMFIMWPVCSDTANIAIVLKFMSMCGHPVSGLRNYCFGTVVSRISIIIELVKCHSLTRDSTACGCFPLGLLYGVATVYQDDLDAL